mgnify:FL=1
MDSPCEFSSSRCKRFSELKRAYDAIVEENERGYVEALKDFDRLVETRIRKTLGRGRSADQAWKSCKGGLYEYAVCRAIEEMLVEIPGLSERLALVHGTRLSEEYRQQIVIANWTEIMPDTDLAIVDLKTGKVRAILSCKTSLRERLTETAFWRKELSERGIEYIFVTTDKDGEIRIDTNRYIVMHVIDYTIITDPKQLQNTVEYWRKRFGDRNDFDALIAKIGGIEKLCEILCKLAGLRDRTHLCCRGLER